MKNLIMRLASETGTRAALVFALAVGIVCVVLIDDPRTELIVFLAVTCVESGLYCLVVGLFSTWRRAAAARAVFWAVLGYFLVTTQAFTIYVWGRAEWTDNVRALIYLFLVVAGLNLMLVMLRLLGGAADPEPAPPVDSVDGSRQ